MALIEILPTVWVSHRASVDAGVHWGRYIRVYGQAHIASGTVIGDFVTIGCPSPEELAAARRDLSESAGSGTRSGTLDALDEFVVDPTEIGPDSIVRGPTSIYSGVSVGARLDCAHNVTVRERCRIGDDCYLKVNTELRREVVVGDRATLAGTVGDRASIGDDVTSFGSLIHKYSRVRRGLTEMGPTLKSGCFVGRNTSVIGPVVVGETAYVAAGAVVARDVPKGSLVVGETGTVHPDRSPVLRASDRNKE